MPFEVATAGRTILASGYAVVDFMRHPRHTDFMCTKKDSLGVLVPYSFAFFHDDPESQDELDDLKRYFENQASHAVMVTPTGAFKTLSWDDFTAALGGAVPSWRVLADDYPQLLRTASRNKRPVGIEGEAWVIFEELVADGLEFVFGRRVSRLGSRRRGRTVSDMVTQTPDGRVVVLDTKSSAGPFDVGTPELRPLKDYLRRQQQRQVGGDPVRAVLLVAPEYAQGRERIDELSRAFLGEMGVPLSFLEVETLVEMVTTLIDSPRLRNVLNWSSLVCSGSLVSITAFRDEVESARDERFPPRDNIRG